jgi:monofunctional biosynthetic peptidoglycan transglycosylase
LLEITNALKKFLNFALIVVIVFISISIFSVILFRFIPPPITPLMIIRYISNDGKDGERKIEKEWVSIDKISPQMILASVAAEDNKFADHFGFDWEAIQKAKEINKYNYIKHGASTITQQTAKNLFLTPSRTYLRKGFEVYFTLLLEVFWSKKRIMEVYLNIVELGDGIYGIEAASLKYYHKPALKLTRNESAMMAAALPSPRKRNPAKPNGYMYYYQGRVLDLMQKIGKVEL